VACRLLLAARPPAAGHRGGAYSSWRDSTGIRAPAAAGPPVAPVAGEGPVPRILHRNGRAPEGFKRFQSRCTSYAERPLRYILALDRASAERHYLRAVGLLDALQSARPDLAEPELSWSNCRTSYSHSAPS